MLLLPFNPPKQFLLPPRSSKLTDDSIDDNNIIDIITLAQANITVLLTSSRVLVYNLKPMALVAVQERTQSSIDEFGSNKSIRQSTAIQNSIDGFSLDTETDTHVMLQENFMFYVITEKNFLLTYQILKNSTSRNTFIDYGLPVFDCTVGEEDINEDYDHNLDDDILTVFDKQKSSRIIQNGLVANKEKSFFQALLNNQDNIDEMPIKRVELRLKIVLKFDFSILDILGYKKVTSLEEGKYEENLIILHQDGLQLLGLVDFKLVDSKLIKLSHGFKICTHRDKVIVVCYDKETQETSIVQIDMEKLSTSSLLLNENTTLISAFQTKFGISLIYEKKIILFDPYANKVSYQFSVPFSIKICNYVNEDVFIFITTQNCIYFYTRYGNHLFSTYYDKDDTSSFPLFNYSNYVYAHDILITTTTDGQYHTWQLWQESNQNQFNFRNTSALVLHKDNDIMIYFPQGDSPSGSNILPTIKLPTKSLNNYISHISPNGNLKLLAVFIANKKLLLIHNLETTVWFNYPDMIIIDIQWLSNNYLIMQTKSEEGEVFIRCIHVPLQGAENMSISDMITWEYRVPSSVKIRSFYVNTLSVYKPLKIKLKDNNMKLAQYEKFYKTGEIIIVTSTDIVVFDVISSISSSGVNILKRIFEYAKIDISDDAALRNIEWALSFKEGILLYADKKIYKLIKWGNDKWQRMELLHNIERIIDILQNKIFLVESKKYLAYDLEDLWDEKEEILAVNINEDGYPISVSPDSAILHSLECIFNKKFSKLNIKHDIYLDKLIIAKLDSGVSLEAISSNFHSLKHYKFALEKILSSKILKDEDLTQILQLVKSCYISVEESRKHPYGCMLEIISNCLRKIEIQYWDKLFFELKMTPRDLLGLCIEGNEAKVLGVLLLVFLNYNETDLIKDLKKREKGDERNNLGDIDEKEEYVEDQTNVSAEVTVDSELKANDTSVGRALTDDELMLRVLNVLVTSATSTDEPNLASDAWDMCFQLVRFLKELDRQNNTNLVQKAIEML